MNLKISGHGYQGARVMLIADGATDDDIASGYAITGQAERTLASFCRDNKLKFDEFYRTALIKDRINLHDHKANIPLVTDSYKHILSEEIKNIGPNVIVPLSELSFNFVTGVSGIRKFRGSVLPARMDFTGRPIRTIPILGPNPYLNEDYKLHFITRLDFSKVARNIDATGVIEEIGKVWVATSADALRNYFSRHYSKAEYVVIDIETYVGIPTCISFCFDGQESVTAPILDRSLSFDTRMLMIKVIAELLASPLPKVNQNIKFDWKKLERFGFDVKNVVGDTLLAASCLYAEFPKNLGFLTSLYTDMPYFKDEGKQFDPSVHDRSRLYLYCAKDSLATHQIYTAQKQELVEMGVGKVYDKLIEILPIYKRMEQLGIRVDNEQREKLIAKYESKFDIQLYKLHSLCGGREINPLSPIQIRKIVYDELGYTKIRGIKTTAGGEAATDEESLELLMWMGHPRGTNVQETKEILKAVIACRKLHKVIEYLYSPIHPDGRARCEFNLGGSETGRTTSGKTTDNLLIVKKDKVKLVDLGRSFQNIGKHGFEVEGEDCGQDLRSIFVPSPGYSFVECDLSQAEARVDAVLARDFDILSVFDGPIGIHRLTGNWIYNCPPEEIKKHVLVDGVDRYHQAKTARHAGERNMRADRLMMMIHQPIRECERILKTFHEKQPNIREVFHREIREQIQKHRVLISPNGRRRDFYGRFDQHQINEGISTLPQAIVTDYLKNGLRRTFEECDYARPLNEQHDGFLAEVPEGKERAYGEVFVRNTQVGIDFRTCSLARDFELTIPVEVEWSNTNWSNMENLK